MSLSPHTLRYSMFRKPVKEEDVQRLKVIQMAALLPVLLCFTFFLLTANIYLLFMLIFLLIIAVLLPWILREILTSHLVLQQRVEDLAARGQPTEPPGDG